MKKVKRMLGVITIICFCCTGLVTVSYGQEKMGDKKMKTSVMMKDGTMMLMKDGKTMAMEKDMTMTNGTVVMMDGTVKTKDGKTMMMKEGQSMDMNGKMMMKRKM